MVLQIVETALPALSQQAFVPRIAEVIQAEIQNGARTPVVIQVAPDQQQALEDLTDHTAGTPPIEVQVDAALAEGQVFLRFGEAQEHEINTTAVHHRILEALQYIFLPRLSRFTRMRFSR